MEILRATFKDLDRLVPLFNAYRAFYGQDEDSERTADFLAQRLKNGDSVIFLATDPAGHALGFTQLYPSFSSVSLKRLWILNDLFVEESARRGGIAAALLQEALRHAEETKSKGLVLETGTDNLAAQKLYERLGWTKEPQFLKYFLNLHAPEQS